LPWADFFHAFGVVGIQFPDGLGQASSGTPIPNIDRALVRRARRPGQESKVCAPLVPSRGRGQSCDAMVCLPRLRWGSKRRTGDSRSIGRQAFPAPSRQRPGCPPRAVRRARPRHASAGHARMHIERAADEPRLGDSGCCRAASQAHGIESARGQAASATRAIRRRAAGHDSLGPPGQDGPGLALYNPQTSFQRRHPRPIVLEAHHTDLGRAIKAVFGHPGRENSRQGTAAGFRLLSDIVCSASGATESRTGRASCWSSFYLLERLGMIAQV